MKGKDEFSRDENEDLMSYLLFSLKTRIINTKQARTIDKCDEFSHISWLYQSEVFLKEVLDIFFVYCFNDVHLFLRSREKLTDSHGSNNSHGPYYFDLTRFLDHRRKMGDAKPLLEFFTKFSQSQMFERFCEEIHSSNSNFEIASSKETTVSSLTSLESNTTEGSFDESFSGPPLPKSECDIFEVACKLLRKRQHPAAVADAKEAIRGINSSIGLESQKTIEHQLNVASSHKAAIQLTSLSSKFSFQTYLDFYDIEPRIITESCKNSYYAKSCEAKLLESIILDCTLSTELNKVVDVILYRLQSCIGQDCKKSTGIMGMKGILLLFLFYHFCFI